MGIRLQAVFACGLTVASALISAQTAPEVTFKVEVNSVEEDVRVLDKQGNLVRGLTRDDFQVTEDGKPQRIATFGLVDLPLAPRGRPQGSILSIESDVVSNQDAQDGRLYLIVLDDYHVDPARTLRVRSLLRQFVLEKLDDKDQAAIVVTSGRSDASQDFTQSRRRLLDTVDRFSGQKLPSVTSVLLDIATRDASAGSQAGNPDSGVVASRRTPNTFLNDADIAERVQRARQSLNTLTSLSDWMSRVHGRRKALIYVTEGIDYTNYGAFAGPDSATRNFEQVKGIEDQVQEAVSAATRGNVQIYPVDPRGLAPMSSDVQIEDARASISARQAFGAERSAAQERLRELAEKTGGVVATGTNDLEAAFDRIVQENSSYYVLGYYSSNEKADGKVRTLNVKVKGYPDSQVSFRKQYTAASPKKAPIPPSSVVGLLADAMRSPLPLAGIPFRLAVIPHRGQGKNVSLELLCEFSSGDLKFQTNGETHDNTIYVSIAAFTKAGKSVAEDRRAIELKLKPDTFQRVNKFGVRVLRQIEVPPGSYSIHVAVRDAVEGKQGSLRMDVEAPDFAAAPLSISGLMLTAANGSGAYAVGADLFSSGLPAAPTALREFASEDTLATLVEIYDSNRTTPHAIDLRATVTAADGRTVFDKHEEAAIDGRTPAGGVGYRTAVPLQGWAPGSYVLIVEARSRLGNTPAVSRAVPFSVR